MFVIVLALVLITAFVKPRPKAAPEPTGTQTAVDAVDAAQACTRLGPLLTSGDQFFSAVGAGHAPPAADLRAALNQARSIEPLAPPTWRKDVTTVADTLQRLVDAHGDAGSMTLAGYDSFASAAGRLTEDCAAALPESSATAG